VEIKKLVGRSTARKSPIGSTNNQWGGTKPPLIKVSLYYYCAGAYYRNNQ